MNDISIDVTNATGEDKNASQESLAGSHCSMAVQSPWETRRMKADLIEARSRVTFCFDFFGLVSLKLFLFRRLQC